LRIEITDSIAANPSGTVVIGCNGSSASVYISSYVLVGQVANGTLSFGNLTLLAAGSTSYQNTDFSGISRWGDYSATSVDPEDPNRFWTIQSIATGDSTWTTQITEIITGLALSITSVGDRVVISWPAAATEYQLQSSSTLNPTDWSPVSQAPTVNDGIASVSLPAIGAPTFFRLAALIPH